SRIMVVSASMAPIALKTYAYPAILPGKKSSPGKIYLGGPLSQDEKREPEVWINALRKKGYGAAFCPLNEDADDSTVNAYKEAARKADIIIAEVGVWNNPISPDEETRKAALEKCISKLELADRIEARCCVNVSGSLGKDKNGGPNPDDLSKDTFDLIVETTRKIIDAVKPSRTYYTLEDMPFRYPDSVDSYLDLIKAIDRKQFAAHLDPVNIINSPTRYFNNGALIKDAFTRLGKYIKSCHAKDTLLSNHLTVHLDEVVPGKGNLDYSVYLTELSKLDNVPMMMEHMEMDEYPQAAAYIKEVGKKNGLSFS
ncbi:sugar phosphate isomerase/epimerase family protein, partial [Bacteroidota bacterium]